MANIWKYADTPQRERLNMIRNGNLDVLNSEKARNKYLKEQQAKYGLSTTVVDDWDKKIDSAYSTYKSSLAKKNAVKYSTGAYDEVNKAYAKAAGTLKAQRDADLMQVQKDRENSFAQLEEWLANNGFSEKGKTSKTSKKELEEAFRLLISNILSEYEDAITQTRKSYFSPYLNK